MKPKATQLKDLDVDRVDAVDKPATGRPFLLYKSSEGDLVLKGYGALATATHELLEKARVDKNLVASRKTAVAFNGAAQVLGEAPVFLSKSVPTQPYVFDEPDADKRGPADEDLGSNFAPRSMPGSMVGSVSFRLKDAEEDEHQSKARMKDEDEDEDEGKGKAAQAQATKSEAQQKAKRAALKAAKRAKQDAEDDGYDEDEAEHRAKAAYDIAFKAASDNDGDEDDDNMDASERANRGVARRLGKMETAIASLAETVNKAITGEVRKVRKNSYDVAPRSRQIEDDEPVQQIEKSVDAGYSRRFQTSFANIAFGNK